MRNLLCILFAFALIGVANAQNAETVFITDAEVEWLDKEVLTLSESLKKMQEAVNEEDPNMIAANKTAIIKSVNRLSSNCNIMNNKIETEINPPTKNAIRDLDTPPDYYYNKKKKVEALQELKLSQTNIDVLNQNGYKLKELKEMLKQGDYKFHPKYPQAEANLKGLYQMLDLAKNSNSIIQRSTVD